MTDTLTVPHFTHDLPNYIRGQHQAPGLRLSHDRKVSPSGIFQASRNRWVATTPNSFGLPAGPTCPDKTGFCASCYAVNSGHSMHVNDLLRHNETLLRATDLQGQINLLAHMVYVYDTEAQRRRLTPEDRLFRIHWSGDLFSVEYAQAWAAVIRANPTIRFWAYTRSFVTVDVVPVLAGLGNLALYLSVDAENAEAARCIAQQYPVRLALCATDYRAARQLIPERDAVACPENTGRMALMADGRGACVTCGICPDGRRDIMFATSHKESVPVPEPKRRQWEPPLSTGPMLGPSTPRSCATPECSGLVYPPPPPARGRPRLYCDVCRVIR